MKAILTSIRPKWVAKILKGDKIIEIRKTAPKEWVEYLSGKTNKIPEPKAVYIYCTKTIKPFSDYDWGEFAFDDLPKLGKVVAKFTLRQVTEICFAPFGDELSEEEERICSESCLSVGELVGYLRDGMFGYAWHISDLVIFDEPRELKNFRKVGYKSDEYNEAIREAEFILTMDHVFKNGPNATVSDHQFQKECEDAADEIFKIKRAPQSWCYVEAAE